VIKVFSNENDSGIRMKLGKSGEAYFEIEESPTALEPLEEIKHDLSNSLEDDLDQDSNEEESKELNVEDVNIVWTWGAFPIEEYEEDLQEM